MKISIIGTGIHELKQLTLEGLATLQKSSEVYYCSPFDKLYEEFLVKEGLLHFKNLYSCYKDGFLDENSWDEALLEVIERSAPETTIAFLIPGHPRIGISLIQRLERLREEYDFEMEVIPGVSSFDTIVNDLGRDPLERGTVLLDVNRLLLFNIPLEPSLDYLLYHVSSTGTALAYQTNPMYQNQLHLLQQYLEKYYSSAHTVELVFSYQGGLPATRIQTMVGRICLHTHQIHFGMTLFIPAVGVRPVNESFMKLIRNPQSYPLSMKYTTVLRERSVTKKSKRQRTVPPDII